MQESRLTSRGTSTRTHAVAEIAYMPYTFLERFFRIDTRCRFFFFGGCDMLDKMCVSRLPCTNELSNSSSASPPP